MGITRSTISLALQKRLFLFTGDVSKYNIVTVPHFIDIFVNSGQILVSKKMLILVCTVNINFSYLSRMGYLQMKEKENNL